MMFVGSVGVSDTPKGFTSPFGRRPPRARGQMPSRMTR